MESYNTILPTVIDLTLIRNNNNDESIDSTKELSLLYLNIVKIEHLWPLSNLTKLALSNNSITKIENLHSLVHLKYLNLSFNQIEKIENLDNLINLSNLCLYENRVTNIEGLDTLKLLKILNIGRNKIANWDFILYLRHFDKLRSLNVAGNACCKDSYEFNYVISYLPQLIYYNYSTVKLYIEKETFKSNDINGENEIVLKQFDLKNIQKNFPKLFEDELEKQENSSKDHCSNLWSELSELINYCQQHKMDKINDQLQAIFDQLLDIMPCLSKQLIESHDNFVNRQQSNWKMLTKVLEKTSKEYDDFVKYKEFVKNEKLEEKREIWEHFLKNKEENKKECRNLLMWNECTLFDQMNNIIEKEDKKIENLRNMLKNDLSNIFEVIKKDESDYYANVIEQFEEKEGMIKDEKIFINKVKFHKKDAFCFVEDLEEKMYKTIKIWCENKSKEISTQHVKKHRQCILSISEHMIHDP